MGANFRQSASNSRFLNSPYPVPPARKSVSIAATSSCVATSLYSETIAEFVTDEQTQQMVARLGVDHAQGYHIGRPIPIPDLLNHTPTNPL